MVWFFSDDLRILAGNPADLSVDFYGTPAVDGSGNVAKRVASLRAAGITYCVPFPVRTFTLEMQKKNYREMIRANPRWRFCGLYVEI